jgi:hypothetical protein
VVEIITVLVAVTVAVTVAVIVAKDDDSLGFSGIGS